MKEGTKNVVKFITIVVVGLLTVMVGVALIQDHFDQQHENARMTVGGIYNLVDRNDSINKNYRIILWKEGDGILWVSDNDTTPKNTFDNIKLRFDWNCNPSATRLEIKNVWASAEMFKVIGDTLVCGNGENIRLVPESNQEQAWISRKDFIKFLNTPECKDVAVEILREKLEMLNDVDSLPEYYDIKIKLSPHFNTYTVDFKYKDRLLFLPITYREHFAVNVNHVLRRRNGI